MLTAQCSTLRNEQSSKHNLFDSFFSCYTSYVIFSICFLPFFILFFFLPLLKFFVIFLFGILSNFTFSNKTKLKRKKIKKTYLLCFSTYIFIFLIPFPENSIVRIDKKPHTINFDRCYIFITFIKLKRKRRRIKMNELNCIATSYSRFHIGLAFPNIHIVNNIL